MEDALVKPDIVLVTKNIMVPLALPAPENKFFPAPRISRKKTTIVRARKSRVSPGRAVRSGENGLLRTNVELLRSSDYLACDYDSLLDWEQDLHKNYKLLYSEGVALGEAGFGDSRTEGNGRLDCLSQSFPERCKTFSLRKDGNYRNLDETEGKEMLFEGSRQTGIDLEEETDDLEISTGGKDYNESFNHGGKDRTSAETETERNKKENCLSWNFLEYCNTFATMNAGKDRNLDEAEGKGMLFKASRQNGIDLGEEKNYLGISTMGRDYNKSFNLCGKGSTLGVTISGETETKSNDKHCETFSLKNNEKYEISDGVEGKEILTGRSRQNEIDRREEKNNPGISTRARDYNESFNRCGKGSTLGVTISGETEVERNEKQNCLSQSFPACSMPATICTKMFKTSLLSDRKDDGRAEADRKEITSDESTKNDLKIFDGNVRWKSRESSTTELRRCASSAMSFERSKSFGKERHEGPNIKECEMKYSWQDLENWVPPSAKKRIAEVDEKSDLTGAKKLDCKITYSWQIIGTAAQTSYELIRSLLTSAEEGKGKRAEEAANYPCAVKYSWQIIGTGTQVSFPRGNEDSLPIDGDYWNGKILKSRKRFVEGSKDGSRPITGSAKILYSEMTQTVVDESHQTELGDCRVKYSWQNLTKPYLETIRRL